MAQPSPTRIRVEIRVTLGDFDPLNKVPFKRARSRVKEGPFKGSPSSYYLRLMIKIPQYLKDPKLWELWYIPDYG